MDPVNHMELSNRSKGSANANVDDEQYKDENGIWPNREARGLTGIQALDVCAQSYPYFIPSTH